MQNKEETEKINRFLYMASPIIIHIIRTILQSLTYEVILKGQGINIVFSIKQNEKEAVFYLHNLFLEIATIDRDVQPLMFDEKLRDFDYFMTKMGQLIASKLNVLLQVFGHEDLEAAIENIVKDSKQYERIRIWRFDRKPSSEHQLW